jgi:hypothetical protein
VPIARSGYADRQAGLIAVPHHHPKGRPTVLTILLVVVLILLLTGGGWGYSRRGRV